MGLKSSIKELLPAYLEGRTDADQTEAVERWLDESEENRALLRDEAEVLQITDTLDSLNRAGRQTPRSSLKRRMLRKQAGRILKWVEGIAAAAFIPMVILSISLASGQKDAIQDSDISIDTNPGMMASLVLPDGTKVKLNSGSKITYPSVFGKKERRVSIEGEGFFEVSKNSDCPFYVTTPQGTEIKVTGTAFNVDAYPSEDFMSITLEEGRVEALYQDDRGELAMRTILAGERGYYSKKYGIMSVDPVEVGVFTSWRNGKLIFRSTPFSDVFRCLAKRYGVHFIVRNPNVVRYSFTGELEDQRLERVLEYISSASMIKFTDKRSIDGKVNDIEVY